MKIKFLLLFVMTSLMLIRPASADFDYDMAGSEGCSIQNPIFLKEAVDIVSKKLPVVVAEKFSELLGQNISPDQIIPRFKNINSIDLDDLSFNGEFTFEFKDGDEPYSFRLIDVKFAGVDEQSRPPNWVDLKETIKLDGIKRFIKKESTICRISFVGYDVRASQGNYRPVIDASLYNIGSKEHKIEEQINARIQIPIDELFSSNEGESVE